MTPAQRRARVLEHAKNYEIIHNAGRTTIETVEEQEENSKPYMIIKEVLYTTNEPLELSDDVYALTIAANMTKTCQPMSLQFGIRSCIFVFSVQMLVAIFFAYETLPLDGFKLTNFTLAQTIMRIICSIFLQIKLNAELKNTLKLLTYIKH